MLAEVPEPDGPDGARHFGLVVDDRDEVAAPPRGLRRGCAAQPRPRLPRSVGQPRAGRGVRRRAVHEGAARARRDGVGRAREVAGCAA